MSAELISWTIAIQVALPFIILSLVLAISLLNAKKKSKLAVRNLIVKIKNNEERQKENLKRFLTTKLDFDEAKTKDLTKVIINERKFLFRNLISAFLDKNTTAMAGLEDDLSRITDRYHGLEITPKVAVVEETKAVDDEAAAKVAELKKEMKSLKHEIHVTLTTLNNIFGEFSSMFGEEVPDKELSVDQIITAMQTFTSEQTDSNEVIAPVESAAAVPLSQKDELEELDAFAAAVAEQENSAPAPAPAAAETMQQTENEAVVPESETAADELDFSIDSDLDDIDSALDGLELGKTPSDSTKSIKNDATEVSKNEPEPSWDEAFEESGDTKSDEN